MKKLSIILIVLLSVLLAFVACDNSIDAEFDSGTITLDLDTDDYIFDNGTKKLEVKIPSDCETWKNLVDKGCTIKIKDVDGNEEYTLSLDVNSYDQLYFTDSSIWLDVFDENVKALYPQVKIGDQICIGGKYVLWPNL